MLIHLGISIWAMLPNQRNGKGYYDDEDNDDDNYVSPIHESKYPAVEMQHMRFPPTSPQPIFTPRTPAFNKLDGSLDGSYASRWR